MARFLRPEAGKKGSHPMDVLYLGLTVVFFALSYAFIVACDRLS
jgi:hypothetical protein